jgi:hypothetical protein
MGTLLKDWKVAKSWVLVSYSYNPKYSGGKNQVQSQPRQIVHETLS